MPMCRPAGSMFPKSIRTHRLYNVMSSKYNATGTYNNIAHNATIEKCIDFISCAI